jgi:tetratricopeptide (TPR) repeat protein
MNENLFETQYDVTKKSRFRRLYDANKLLIFSTLFVLIIASISFSFYTASKEKKQILLADNYIMAKFYLQNNEKDKGRKILKEIILANNRTYSTLSLFLILDEDLIDDQRELSNLFDHLLANNKFEQEVKNLIIFKETLFLSNFANELEMVENAKQLINTNTLWKPHALLLLGDYFSSKKQYLKAKEFYVQILSLQNLNMELYEQARSQLLLITND